MGASSKFPSREAISEVEPIHLLIAEDNPMGCEMLKESLRRSQLTATRFFCCHTHDQVIDIAKNSQIHVALVSENTGNGSRNGLEIIDYLLHSYPAIRSILLASNLTPDVILEAFRYGAKGLVCRTESIQALSRCIRAVHQGQVCVNSEQMEVLLRGLVETRPARLVIRGTSALTKREEDVGGLVAAGLTNREVAKRLGLSEHTVGNYLFKCYDKLGLSTRVEFVLYILSQRGTNHSVVPVNENRT